MRYKMSEEKWESVMRFFDRVFARPEDFPDKSLVLSLSDEEITKIFTKKRIELVKVIKKKHPKTISILAEIVKRDLTAVERDLKILEGFGVVRLEKKGKKVEPIVDKQILILPLVPIKPMTVEQVARRELVKA